MRRMPTEAKHGFVEGVKKKHAGKWVATRGKRVIAVSDSHEELIKELRRKGLDDLYVFYSAWPKEKEYKFLLLV
jgi:hypothetical protein